MKQRLLFYFVQLVAEFFYYARLTLMNSAVCTLFEGNYHYGVAGLTNSLYCQGYRGAIYAGYKGELPKWADAAESNPDLNWLGSSTLEVSKGLQLHFLPLDTNYHLTNYKPYFMLRLCQGLAQQAEALAYFDPDIVVKCRWEFFERWMGHGVALVHDITSNDMPTSHPIRRDWEQLLIRSGRVVQRPVQSYINGGFCGVAKSHQEFLHTWADILDAAISYYNPDPTQFTSFDKTHPFHFFDQDALNVAAMSSTSPISEMGPEGMDFVYGGWTMAHAVGSPKPWKKNFLADALRGHSPSLADRAFWQYSKAPIRMFQPHEIQRKQISMLLAAFIGRFYHH